ncbi:MAG: hypothetical protein K0R27_3267 [Xanthobacteraceae bacterium]|jgi:hypothetical protein|nr:hypothetical protein [Xanthobacteraceae bacterium]
MNPLNGSNLSFRGKGDLLGRRLIGRRRGGSLSVPRGSTTFLLARPTRSWMAGTSPAMTSNLGERS